MSKSNKRVTLIEVAKEAGVSKSTVSAVLNDDQNARISQETRDKVLRAAAKVNYRPNMIARAMRTGTSHTIGVSVASIVSNFYPQAIMGIEQVLQEEGYNVLLAGNRYDSTREIKNIDLFLQKQVDGIIMISSSGTKQNQRLVELSNNKVPLIVINRHIDDKNVSTVNFDNTKGAFNAVKHLIDNGHKDIAFIRPYYDDKRFRSKTLEHVEDGYKLALEEAGLPFSRDRIYEANMVPIVRGEAFHLICRLMDTKSLPTAFFCASDYFAVDVIRSLTEAGIKIPGEISVIGYNDMEIALATAPSLTSVQQPLAESGRVAAGILLDVIKGIDDTPKKVLLPCKLKIRESSGPIRL